MNNAVNRQQWLTLSDFDRDAANEALEKFRANDSQPLTTKEFEMEQKVEVASRSGLGLLIFSVAAIGAVGAIVWLVSLGQLVSGFAR